MTAPQRVTNVPRMESSPATRRLTAVRSQAAFVRALLDEVERAVPPHAAAVGAQLVEEVARLGCSFLEAAQALREELDQTEGGLHRERPDGAQACERDTPALCLIHRSPTTE